MLLQQIMSQNANESVESISNINWNASEDGNYQNNLAKTKRIIWQPTQANDRAYNHHNFLKKHNNALHIIHSTCNTGEEDPGMWIRYTKITDLVNFNNHTTHVDLFPPQDDVSKPILEGGRVCVPCGFAIVNGELYGVTDVNDRSASNEHPRDRVPVGILARKINDDGTFGAIKWIKNKQGNTVAPLPISGYASYDFDFNLGLSIDNYFRSHPNNYPVWYFSVPDSDPLYNRGVFNGDVLVEPSSCVINETILKLWRKTGVAPYYKIGQTSINGIVWSDPFETGIPDSPSLSKVLNIGSNIGIIGNNFGGTRIPLFFAISEDGLSYESLNVYDIESQTTSLVFSGHGKGIGFQYPSLIDLEDGRLASCYSENKENIILSVFDKPPIV